MQSPRFDRRRSTTDTDRPESGKTAACARFTSAGFTVTEVVITMILLGAVISMIAPLTRRAIDQREQSQQRRAALIEVSNALERIAADPSSWPAPGEELSLPLPEEVAAPFDDPQLTITSVSLQEPVAGRRFDAALTWRAPNGRQAAPLRLSAFAFPSPPAPSAGPMGFEPVFPITDHSP